MTLKQCFKKDICVIGSAAILFLSACHSDKNVSGSGSPTVPPKENPQDPPEPDVSPTKNDSISFKKFGMIKEFGGTDNAAVFGLLPETGKFQITKIIGPAFLDVYEIGELNQTRVGTLFSSTSGPLNQTEKDDLVSEFNGATIIYVHGYNGNLCRQDEVEYVIKATGKLNDTDIEVNFFFQALPNVDGNCKFHIFGTLAKYVN